jgi:putative ABC transport system ATP-binding protein
MTRPPDPVPELPAAPPAATAIGLSKVYGTGPARVAALDRIDVEIPAGRFTAVMGPSGSGKSTLMHCLAGLDRPTSGSVRLGQIALHTLSDGALTDLRRREIGFVFQAYNLVATLTARENIVLPAIIDGKDPDPGWLAAIAKVLGLADRLEHRPAELSGGQQQRVALARALVTRPQIVFADEPTGSLDSRSGADLLRLMRHSVDALGQTVVMVSHDPAAAAIADQVLFLADGRLVDRLPSPTVERVLERLARFDRVVA